MTRMKTLKPLLVMLLVVCMVFGGTAKADAYTYSTLPEGTYNVNASLSCYVNAMGGIEFGAPLLTSAKVRVASDGSKTMTLGFTKSSVTIYEVTCDTFIDGTAGTVGYYTKSGSLSTSGVSYTRNGGTAENSKGEQVKYVNSMTFPLDHENSAYNLALYINSNVMGTQFSNAEYPAVLTVDWSSLPEKPAESKSDSSSGTGKSETSGNKNGGSSSGSDNGENAADGTGGNVEEITEDGTSKVTKKNSKSARNGASALENLDGDVIAYFNQPLLIGAAIAGALMVLVGVVMVARSRRGKK